MHTPTMKQLGLDDRHAACLNQYDGCFAGRVFSQGKDIWRVMCEGTELYAEVSGRFRFEARLASDYPCVGDFVVLDRDTDTSGNAIIHHVLPRKSVFLRQAAGDAGGEQVVAGNIDTIFICMSLNNDFNLRRLERYMSIAWNSGATPVVVLTKSDLCAKLPELTRQVGSVAMGADILVTSSILEDGYTGLMKYISEGKTVAFVGSSGVGKSTLINCLLGEQRLDTRGLSGGDKGRHTTTRRELILLPCGGMVIDTPGMRELGIESADISKAFADISELEAMCKYSDCTHSGEPGCAVRAAIADYKLTEERLQSYYKLKKEAKYDGMNARQIENAKIGSVFGSMSSMKNFRRQYKEHGKGR